MILVIILLIDSGFTLSEFEIPNLIICFRGESVMSFDIKRICFHKRVKFGVLLGVGMISITMLGNLDAETPAKKTSEPVRILLTDDTPDSELSIRRKPADSRNLEKLYLNELRPRKTDVLPTTPQATKPQIITPADVEKPVLAKKPEPPTAEVPPETAVSPSDGSSTTPTLNSLLPKIEIPEFNLFPETQPKDKPVVQRRVPQPAADDGDEQPHIRRTPREAQMRTSDSSSRTPAAFPEFPSLETLLPKLELPQFEFPEIDLFTPSDADSKVTEDETDGDRELTIQDSAGTRTFRPGPTPTHSGEVAKTTTSSAATSAPVYLPEIGSLRDIQLPDIELPMLDLFFGTESKPLIDSNGDVPVDVKETIKEKNKEANKQMKHETRSKALSGMVEFFGLEDLSLQGLTAPLLENPFKDSSPTDANSKNETPMEKQETKVIDDQGEGLSPDEGIAAELPQLDTTRPDVPGIKQIPTLAPKEVPDTKIESEIPAAPNTIDKLDKSTLRTSPFQPLVNPDTIIHELRQPVTGQPARKVSATLR